MPSLPRQPEQDEIVEQLPQQPVAPADNTGYRRRATLHTQDKLGDYVDFAKSITKEKNITRQAVLFALENRLAPYNALIGQYTQPIQNGPAAGNYPVMDKNKITTLKKHLASAHQVTNAYLQSRNKKDAFYSTMQKIDNILVNEYKHFRTFDPTKQNQTLPGILEASKGKSVVISPDTGFVHKMTGCLSTRMLLKFQEGENTRKGVFTEQSLVDYNNAFPRALQEWQKSAEAMKYTQNQFADLANIPDETVREKKRQTYQLQNRQCDELKGFFNSMEKWRKSYASDKTPAEFYLDTFRINENNELKVDKSAPKAIRNYVNDHIKEAPFSSWYSGFLKTFVKDNEGPYFLYHKRHQLGQGERIDSRSSAMSAVAGLLEQDHLLAKAEPMTLKNPDGSVVKGTFMDYASGTDLRNLYPEDPCFKAEGKAIVGGEGLKSAADLNVLDYICSNTDRHDSNMLYQFDENGKFRGVVGIDNDLSFGNMGTGARGYGSEPEDLQVVSRQMADRIKQINPEMLRLTLGGYGMKTGELDSAVKRLKTVKGMIANGSIRTVEDNEWGAIKLDDLCAKTKRGGGVFNMLNKANDNIKQEKDKITKAAQAKTDLAALEEERTRRINEVNADPNIRPEDREKSISDIRKEINERKSQITVPRTPGPKKIPKFTEVGTGLDLATQDYRMLSGKMSAFVEDLKTANKGFFIGSKEYDNMMNYASYMNDELAKMAFEDKPYREEELRQFERDRAERTKAMFSTMRDIAGMYADHRKKDGKLLTSDTAQKRALAATRLLSFTNSNCKKFNVTADDLYRAGMDQERRRAAYKRMSAKEIGTQIKSLRNAADAGTQKQRQDQLKDYLEQRKKQPPEPPKKEKKAPAVG